MSNSGIGSSSSSRDHEISAANDAATLLMTMSNTIVEGIELDVIDQFDNISGLPIGNRNSNSSSGGQGASRPAPPDGGPMLTLHKQLYDFPDPYGSDMLSLESNMYFNTVINEALWVASPT